MSIADPVPWRRFSHDPRLAESARLRASDQDRNVVLEVLTEAYADGRLDREEYDTRSDVATHAKTLGELPPIVADLVPQTPSRSSSDLALASPEELRARAVEAFRASRRKALSGVLVPSLICVVIWLATGWPNPGFPWPLFVILGTGANLMRVLMHRQDLIDDERRRLEKRQRKALEAPDQDTA